MSADPRLTPPAGPGQPLRIAAGAAPLRKEPRPDAPLLTEAIFGEPVTAYAAQDAEAGLVVEIEVGLVVHADVRLPRRRARPATTIFDIGHINLLRRRLI